MKIEIKKKENQAAASHRHYWCWDTRYLLFVLNDIFGLDVTSICHRFKPWLLLQKAKLSCTYIHSTVCNLRLQLPSTTVMREIHEVTCMALVWWVVVVLGCGCRCGCWLVEWQIVCLAFSYNFSMSVLVGLQNLFSSSHGIQPWLK